MVAHRGTHGARTMDLTGGIMDRVPFVSARLRTRSLVAAGLGVTLMVGLAPGAQAADAGRGGLRSGTVIATPDAAPYLGAPPVAALQRGSGLHAAASDFLVYDEHADPAGDAALTPDLTGALMAVLANDPTTSYDESRVLVIAGETSTTTVESDVPEVDLDLDGDSQDDLWLPSPDGALPLGEPVGGGIWTHASGDWVDTGQVAAWTRVAEGYLVAFDYRDLGLTAARFTFGLSDTAEGSVVDWAPDDYTGAPVALPSAVPSSPQDVHALAGDGRAKVIWTPPANSGSNPITSYTVTSYPDGRSCTTTGLSCVVNGLTNQQAYTFGVVAVSASGTSTPTTSDAIVPQPFTKVIVRAKRSGRVLYVNVNPNLTGSKYWRFRVIRKAADGTWVPKKVYRTRGAGETRTIDLPKGRYRVVVLPKYGYQASVSRAVTLRR